MTKAHLRTASLALLLLGAGAGCDGDAPAASTSTAPASTAASGHVHDPLFGGALVELGDHFANLEVVFDAASGTLDLYLLSAHADSVVKGAQARIDLVVELASGPIELAALPQASSLADNAPGSSSHFQVQDERLRGIQRLRLKVRELELLGATFRDVLVECAWKESR